MIALKKFSTQPQGVIVKRQGGKTFIMFDFQKEEAQQDSNSEEASAETGSADTPAAADTSQSSNFYYYRRVVLTSICPYKAEVIAAIINDRYNDDEQKAIIANFTLAQDTDSGISDNKRLEYRQEYYDFQAWRTHAKQIAAQALAITQQ